ncbi:hypothetical protein O9929_07865 [Vibrio lentus]|nr:hypothetical protein [Vibrio lentus]
MAVWHSGHVRDTWLHFTLKGTKIDSGISRGITPVAAANATKPEPAGNEIPRGETSMRAHHLYQQYQAEACRLQPMSE